MCIDEMEVVGKFERRFAFNVIRPCCDSGEIILGLVIQKLLEISSRLLLHKGAGQVGDRDMSKICGIRDQYTISSLEASASERLYSQLRRLLYLPPQAATLGKSRLSAAMPDPSFMVTKHFKRTSQVYFRRNGRNEVHLVRKQ
jgi:hypothetical protein